MLKKIDKYIIRKFLTTFFFMLGVIMVLATVFDLAEKLSDFIKEGMTREEAKAALEAIKNKYVMILQILVFQRLLD